MKLVSPPYTTNVGPSLCKQVQVVTLCFQPEHDILLQAPLDCMQLDETHSELHMARTREQGKHGHGTTPDHRKVLHAEASCANMQLAAHAAVKSVYDNVPMAFSPTAGFSQAGHSWMTNQSTFNGLIAAAMWIKKKDFARQVLILDGDARFGGPTMELIKHHDIDWINYMHIAGPAAKDQWQEMTRRIIREHDLVLYQAGANAHEADPSGLGLLNDEEYAGRDQFIFELCKAGSIPIAWNISGGEGAKAIDLHTGTFAIASEIYYPTVKRLRPIQRAADVFQEYQVKPPEPELPPAPPPTS